MSEPAAVKPDGDAGVRERLLGAALTLFNEKGYAGTSVREVVAAAGVTKPVLYYYFGSKEGLYLELMRNSYASFQSLVEGVALEGSAREAIIRFCSDVFDISLERLAEVRLIYAMYYGPPQGAPPFDMDLYFFGLLELIKSLVRAGIGSGEFREEDLDDLSRGIVGLLISSVNELLARRAEKLDRDGMVRLLRLLLKGAAGN